MADRRRPRRGRLDLDDAVRHACAADRIAGAGLLAAAAVDVARRPIIGGFLFRLGIGALPFLLPLLMQVGFGLSPFQSGLVTFASAVGAMGMKTLAARIIRTFGFRNLMTVNAVVSSVFLAACALFTVTTPLLLIFIILVVGGFFRSLQFTAINTVAYAEVEPAQMSRATTLVSVNQQLAISAGVAVGAFSVEMTMWLHHVTELDAAVFAPAFLVVSLISAASAWFFWQMPDDAGHEISGRKAVEISSRKGAAKAAATAPAKDPGRAGSAAGVSRNCGTCAELSTCIGRAGQSLTCRTR